MEGEGVARFATGDVYEGGFLDGARHGFGVLQYASGEVLAGEWADDALVARQTPDSAADGGDSPAANEVPEPADEG